MSEYKTTYRIDSFYDYAGKQRQFVLALVSEKISGEYCQKGCHIGLSVCHADDTFNVELGQRIAYGKALSSKRSIGHIALSDCSLMNNKIANAVLESIAEYIKQDPGQYISGYNKQKAKWNPEKILDLSLLP